MARLTASQRTSLTILVAALGYFVDVFDLQLFAMLRVTSLSSLGLDREKITEVGSALLNWQMAGMMAGGILWGVLGDRKGRVWVLFGTILLYSLGNIANAFVTSVPAYAAARFITGLGLAGEIGAGVTLASELLPTRMRGYATSVIVTCGVMGPVVASSMADFLNWHYAYIGGGCLGLLLLTLRISVNESSLFASLNDIKVPRGHFQMLFTNRLRFTRYATCIFSAVPIWFVVGTLAIFAPELGRAIGTDTPLTASTAIVSCYIGLTLGGFLSGLLSQLAKSRRLVMAVFILGSMLTSFTLLSISNISSSAFYGLIGLNGFFAGYWTLFMTTTAEQFGTNLRATATTTAPNFVRGSIILSSILIAYLKPGYGLTTSVLIDGCLCYGVAFMALLFLPETFDRDLNYLER